MKISVIMPVYNESISEINESIDSILKQTYTHFEFIIINDNPTSKIIYKYLIFRKKLDNRIKLILNKRNLGLTKSLNKAINKSSGDFIIRMDADDISSKNRIYNQVKFAQENNLDLVCSNFADLDSKLPYLGNKDQSNQKIIKKIMSHCNIAIGPTISFNKRIINKVKGYRNLFTDDYDIAARVLINGYKIGYQSNIFIYKRNRKENISNNHSLEEFITNQIISNAISNDDYNKIEHLYYINNKIKLINKKDKSNYKKFKFYYNKMKHKRNISNLFYVLKYTFSSPLILKRNMWMLFINKRYKRYI